MPREHTYTYLASTWATPELDMDGEIVPCYVMQDEAEGRWGKEVAPSDLYWPDSSLVILNARELHVTPAN